MRGKRTNTWTLHFPHGRVESGTYVSGLRNGNWTIRGTYESGTFAGEGPYLDNRKSGHWVEQTSGGVVRQGPFEDGERNGYWTVSNANGTVMQEGRYLEGRQEGKWIYRSADGNVRNELLFEKGTVIEQ